MAADLLAADYGSQRQVLTRDASVAGISFPWSKRYDFTIRIRVMHSLTFHFRINLLLPAFKTWTLQKGNTNIYGSSIILGLVGKQANAKTKGPGLLSAPAAPERTENPAQTRGLARAHRFL